MAVNSGGPLVKAALFCEQILQEKDGTMTFVRVVDRFTIHGPLEVPPGTPPRVLRLKLGLMLVSGESGGGTHTLGIKITKPSGGIYKEPREIPIELPATPEGGLNISGDVDLELDEEGVYWTEIAIDGALATRSPVRVIFEAPKEP